jgi:hypothetical protein
MRLNMAALRTLQFRAAITIRPSRRPCVEQCEITGGKYTRKSDVLGSRLTLPQWIRDHRVAICWELSATAQHITVPQLREIEIAFDKKSLKGLDGQYTVFGPRIGSIDQR